MACHLWSPLAPGRNVITLCAGDTAGLAQSWLELSRHLMLPADLKQALGKPLPPGTSFQQSTSSWQNNFTMTVPYIATGKAGDCQVGDYQDGRVRCGKPGQPEREAHLPNSWWVHQVGITLDGQRIIASANMDGNIFVLDGSKAKAPVLWQARLNVPINTDVEPDHFAFDPNADLLYVNQLEPPSITAYDVRDMRQVWQYPLLVPQKANLTSVWLALSGDGKTLALTYRIWAYGDASAEVKKLAGAHLMVLDAMNGTLKYEARQPDIWVATDFADACAISRDGTVISCASIAPDLYIFDNAGKLVK